MSFEPTLYDSTLPAPVLEPSNTRALALAVQAAIDAGHARRIELERERDEEKNRRIREIFNTLVLSDPDDSTTGYLFNRITAAIAEGATSISIPCGNALPDELAAALRMIPGICVVPFNSMHASALQVAWSEKDIQEAIRLADSPPARGPDDTMRSRY